MDWIMEPSIVAYNMVTMSDIGLSLDDILNEFMPGITIQADFTKYQQLLDLITIQGLQHSQNNTGWAYNHADILNFLQLKPGQQVNIFNVDHHHDLGYELKNNLNRIDCSNWVYELHKNGHLNAYYWIKNNNSQLPAPEQISELNNYIASNDICILQNIQFDKVFIATSPSWIPKKYHPLSQAAVELLRVLSSIQNIDK